MAMKLDENMFYKLTIVYDLITNDDDYICIHILR